MRLHGFHQGKLSILPSQSQQVETEELLQLQLQQPQSELERSQAQLQQAQSELNHLQLEHTKTQIELLQAHERINTMQTSKFWRLRTTCSFEKNYRFSSLQ
jgi:chromosome segregation ATPase